MSLAQEALNTVRAANGHLHHERVSNLYSVSDLLLAMNIVQNQRIEAKLDQLLQSQLVHKGE